MIYILGGGGQGGTPLYWEFYYEGEFVILEFEWGEMVGAKVRESGRGGVHLQIFDSKVHEQSLLLSGEK